MNAKRLGAISFGHFAIDILNSSIAIILVSVSQQWDLSNSQIGFGAMIYTFAASLTQPFFATCIVLKTSMRGAGATHTVMRWSFGSMFFYRIFGLWALSHTPWNSLTGVWIVLSIDLLTQAIVFSRLHFRGKWLDARV